MASSLTQALSVLWNSNQKVTSSLMNSMGDSAIQSAFSALGYLLRRTGDDELDGGFSGDSFFPESTGALQITLNKGSGLFIDTTATVPFTDPVLVPLILEADEVVNLDAHQANPRIDVIYATPAVVDFESASVRIWGGAAFSNSTLNTARKRSATIAVQKGTAAATPVKPSIPAGSVEVAVCAVPATTGTAVIADVRKVIQIGDPQGANPDHFQSWVPGSGGELLATASGTAMECSVAAGVCYAGGRKYRFGETTPAVSLGVAPVGNFRYDLLVVDADGSLLVIAAALGAVSPSAGAGQVPVAQFLTLDGSTFPDVTTDKRKRYPIGPDQIDDYAVDTRHIEVDAVETLQIKASAVTASEVADGVLSDTEMTAAQKCVIPQIAVGAEDGSSDIEFTISSEDLVGVTVAEAIEYHCEMFNPSGNSNTGGNPFPEFIAATTGSLNTTANGSQSAFYTADASGDLVFKMSGDAATTGSFRLKVTPMRRHGTPNFAVATWTV